LKLLEENGVENPFMVGFSQHIKRDSMTYTI